MNDDDEIPTLIPSTISASYSQESHKSPIPLTLITGFLGSGKTSLVLRLLNDPKQERKIAVILNEFGESGGMDQALKKLGIGAANNEGDEWLELANGCFCCSVKDMGVKAIENLVKKSPNLDYILLETTGLADPAPIASLFWLDKALQSEIYLDGIITVVDAANLDVYLSAPPSSQTSTNTAARAVVLDPREGGINEAVKQVAMADRVVINKIDLVDSAVVEDLERRIREINSTCVLYQTTKSNVPLDFIFDLHSFDEHQTDPFTNFHTLHTHKVDPLVTTASFTTTQSPINTSRLETWLHGLLWDKKVELKSGVSKEIWIIRFKALLDTGGPCKVLAQSVRELYDVVETPSVWPVDEERVSKFVFIGKGLDKTMLESSFYQSCL